MKKNIPAVVLAIGLMTLLGTSYALADEENTPAPNFQVVDLDGHNMSLASLKGKVIVINFWATTCPPCRAEIPGFVETYKSLKDKGLVIIGLSVDQLSPEVLKQWIAKQGITYPMALATGQLIRDFKPGDYIPSTIIIDAKGNIRFRHVGYLDKKELAALFEKYSADRI